MQLVFAPFWGRLSDRIGRQAGARRRAARHGGCRTSFFASRRKLTLLFASRSLAGFFGATISTAQAYIADVTTPETAPRAWR